MKQIDMSQCQKKLPDFIAELAVGEALILTENDQPLAELRRIGPNFSLKPKIGVAKGTLDVPESFFEPLPAEILDAFQGRY